MHHWIQKLLGDSRHRHFIDYLAEINSGVAAITLLPQLLKLLSGHSAEDLSVATFVIVTATNVVWFMYGLHRRTPPVIIASSVNFLAGGAILLIILLNF
jgi:uncharacterized protein with PQ loop repeat